MSLDPAGDRHRRHQRKDRPGKRCLIPAGRPIGNRCVDCDHVLAVHDHTGLCDLCQLEQLLRKR